MLRADMNNCRCNEQNPYPANEANDVAWLIGNGFNGAYYSARVHRSSFVCKVSARRSCLCVGVKLDGCGSSMNTSNWNRLINATNKQPILTEDGGDTDPPTDDSEGQCPMNMFNFLSGRGLAYENQAARTDQVGDQVGFPWMPDVCYPCLMSTTHPIHPYLQYPTGFISRPGCWAFPGDLQVGNIHPQYDAKLDDMDTTHFSLWAIMSSPLVLGFDLTNSTLVDRVWPIVTNTEVIAVSQNWGGHPGRRAAYASTNSTYKSQHLPDFEIWAKPMPESEWAVLLVNNMARPQNITVKFSDVPWIGAAKLRDLHQHMDLGTASGSFTANDVPIFGSVLLLFSKP